MVYILGLLMGVVGGLRAMTAAAAVSWAAYLSVIGTAGTWLSFLGSFWTVLILSVLAIGEFITDQLPSTPSRTVPVQFGARLVSGALCGAAFGMAGGSAIGGVLAGIVGAAIGTLGGARLRAGLAAAFGRDRPAGFIEDMLAIAGAILIVAVWR